MAEPRIKIPPSDPTKEISGTRTEQRVKMNRMRLRIAERLKEAQNTNAMLTTFNEIDMTNIMEMRKSLGEAFAKKHGVKIGFMSPFVRASAYALMDQPVVNAVIDGQDMVYRDFVDISVAVATPKVHKQAIQLKLRNSSVVKVNGVIIAGPGCTSSS
jgi:2-oxoglutarate dehydrogenase E2 component (dihydrolipoamide succinyltransferase)